MRTVTNFVLVGEVVPSSFLIISYHTMLQGHAVNPLYELYSVKSVYAPYLLTPTNHDIKQHL
jgi:hypothetical protein